MLAKRKTVQEGNPRKNEPKNATSQENKTSEDNAKEVDMNMTDKGSKEAAKQLMGTFSLPDVTIVTNVTNLTFWSQEIEEARPACTEESKRH